MKSVRTIGEFVGFLSGDVIAICQQVVRFQRKCICWAFEQVGWKFLFKPERRKNQCQIIRKTIPAARRWDFNRGRHWDRKRRS